MGLFDEKRRVGVEIAPDVAGEEAGLDMGKNADSHFFIQERMGHLIALSLLPCGENGFSRIVFEKNTSGILGVEIRALDLAAVEKRERGAVGEKGAEFLHEIERERWTSGAVAMEKPALRVESAGFEGGPAVVHEKAVEEGEQGIGGIAGRTAGTSVKRDGGIVICKQAGKDGEVGGGGIALDSAQFLKGNGAGGAADAPVKEVHGLGKFECAGCLLVPVVPRGPLEDAPRVCDFCGHDVAGDIEARGLAVRAAVLFAPEKDIPRGKPVRAGKEFSMRRVERERDPGFRTTGHEGCAGDSVVAEANDAIEIVKRNPKPGLPLVPDLHRLTILPEIRTLQSDEKRVEVGFQRIGYFRFEISGLRFEIFAGRVSGRQAFVKHFQKFLGALFSIVASSAFIRQMSLAFDVRVLQGVRPGADLPRAAFGDGFEICNLRFEILESRTALEEAEHRADFPGRATGDVEERQQLVGRPPLEPLGDVVGDGERRAVDLVALRPGDPVFCGQDKILAALGEADGLLPDGQVFESLVGHGVGIGDFRFEISDCAAWESAS